MQISSDRSKLFSLLLMLFFILAVYIFSNFIVMKDLDLYTALKNSYNIQSTIKSYIDQSKQDLDGYKERLKEYNAYVRNMEKGCKGDEITQILRNYAKKVQIKFIASQKKERVKEDLFAVKLLVATPASFFRFLDDLRKKKLAMKIDYPLSFEKRGDNVAISFRLACYSFAK